MRDNQVTKVIKCEYMVFPKATAKILTKKEALKFIEKIFFKGYYKTEKGSSVIRVKFLDTEKGDAEWDMYGQEIILPIWARTKETILHELSHALCDRNFDHRFTQPHGKEFCTIMLNMVHSYISKKKAVELEQVYSKNGVKYNGNMVNF